MPDIFGMMLHIAWWFCFLVDTFERFGFDLTSEALVDS